ncbi:MAG: hypothetical protein ACC645_15740 [Pirellulales bacterium]
MFANRLWYRLVTWGLILYGQQLVLTPPTARAAKNYKKTGSRSQYTHHIWLYDARERRIDPGSSDALPYSPYQTCKKCHDYRRIARGYHFQDPGLPVRETGAVHDHGRLDRPGEPWIWTDRRSGTQIPLSTQGWPGTYRPEEIGLGPVDFSTLFGRHACGRGLRIETANSAASPPPEEPPSARWNVTGQPEIDCLLCHAADRNYSHAIWASEMARQNFAWAPTAAAGLAQVVGAAKDLPDDFDPDAANGKGVTLHYNTSRFDGEGKVFFDVVRRPPNNACYACHTARLSGPEVPPRWQHDEDIHLQAGLLCVDCHRNGIDHHTVRGFEGEVHPTGLSVASYSCRGCHMGEEDHQDGPARAGRLGAPKPLHAGLPPKHLETISCTACHSGPRPTHAAWAVQTSRAHALGIPSQSRTDDDPPGIVEPVFLKNAEGQLAPYRMMWPAFWGWMTEDRIVPARPDMLHKRLRRALRVRRDFQGELNKASISAQERKELLGADGAETPPDQLTDAQRQMVDHAVTAKAALAFRKKLVKALTSLSEKPDVENARAVFISGGKAYRLNEIGTDVELFDHAVTRPYAWPLAHDVRPARQALGVQGCTECHQKDAGLFTSRVTAVGPAPDDAPVERSMHEFAAYDTELLSAWENAFRWRALFKWFGFGALGVVALILLRGLATWGRGGRGGPRRAQGDARTALAQNEGRGRG